MLPVVILFAAYVLLAAFIAGSTSVHAATEMAYETHQDRKRKRSREDENRPLMKNLFVFNEAPQRTLRVMYQLLVFTFCQESTECVGGAIYVLLLLYITMILCFFHSYSWILSCSC